MAKHSIPMATLAAGAVGVGAFLHWQNYGIHTTRYICRSVKLPRSFKGFKVAHISDFHNTALLTNKIATMTMAEKPDIIAITGDLFDCRHTDIAAGMALVEKLVKIAPVYYVRGNHEAKMENTNQLTDQIQSMGVTVIEDTKISLFRGGDTITLLGTKDPRFISDEDTNNSSTRQIFREKLLGLTNQDDSFKILLSHRPEFIHTYCDSGVELALTGHAHGGQFGIPFTDYGVFVPNQGIFPPYAAGVKQIGDTTVVISRGIGNSVFPFRLFNRPEIVIVELE